MEVAHLTDWSARYLFFHWVAEGQRRRISAFPASGSGETISLRETAFDQGNARLSPDQRWLAYESNESGVREIYVDAFPSQGLRHQVSTSGGSQPRWRRDGRALFFVTPERHLMTVSFEGTGTPHLGLRSQVPRQPEAANPSRGPDGRHRLAGRGAALTAYGVSTLSMAPALRGV